MKAGGRGQARDRGRDGEYEFHRGPVLRMLTKRFPRLDEDDRLALYHEAWGRVLEKRRAGEEIVSLRAYLMASTACDALHAVSRPRGPVPIGPDDPHISQLADSRVQPDEEVVMRDQARIARGVLDSLDERQRQVLKLRWDLQLSGPEVRAALGLSSRQYRRLAEAGATAVAERVEELESGEWSARTRSLLVACVVDVAADDEPRRGIATSRQRERARQLVETDPHAAALFAELRRAMERVAAVTPMPALVAAPGSQLDRVAAVVADLRGTLASTVDAGKQQATAAYLRAADPAVLSGNPRPGAAVAAIAGAVALGGGAFGAYEVAKPPERAETPAAVLDPGPPPPPDTPEVSPSPAASVDPEPAPPVDPPPAPGPQPAPPDPAASAEFTPEAIPPPAAQPPAQPPQPKPAEPTEFGFEN